MLVLRGACKKVDKHLLQPFSVKEHACILLIDIIKVSSDCDVRINKGLFELLDCFVEVVNNRTVLEVRNKPAILNDLLSEQAVRMKLDQITRDQECLGDVFHFRRGVFSLEQGQQPLGK